MSNHSSSTPGGDPTHSTYEVNVPVRNGRTSSPKVENPEIRIPRIKPVSDTNSGASTDHQQQQQQQQQGGDSSAHSTMPQPQNQELQKLAAGLEGKYVDEFGNILDWDGTVLGRVQGDLPSMVGRPVTADGQVLDEDGEVAGQVCDNYIEPEPPKLKPLAAGGLKVDDEGNIYDDQGNKIGKLDQPIKDGADKVSESNSSISPRPSDQKQGQGQSQQGQGGGNAGTANDGAPKPPRPDELFLDVKSTYDGIQLTIKIPTVFNSTMMRETKSSGSQTTETAAGSSSDNR
ncbi:hypothetical protein FIE12Z_3494 [Fusarium flagelliforme]|uniref:Lea domain protein n=1 Tax=Fusarium flagelliforme TaxID=2675880 RepID=A0A395MWD6_9HYPO|nr:hypothetical protein FIE12Z_3494 [Fusarium flagelliforme]